MVSLTRLDTVSDTVSDTVGAGDACLGSTRALSEVGEAEWGLGMPGEAWGGRARPMYAGGSLMRALREAW